jgi:flavodoxin
MKALVVHDSTCGNTEKIARAIDEAAGIQGPIKDGELERAAAWAVQLL